MTETDIAFCIPNDDCYSTTLSMLNSLCAMGTISPETRLYFLFARPRDIGSYLDMLQAYPNIRFITGASSLITTGKEEDYYPNMYHRIYQENVLHKSTNVTFMNTTGNHE